MGFTNKQHPFLLNVGIGEDIVEFNFFAQGGFALVILTF